MGIIETIMGITLVVGVFVALCKVTDEVSAYKETEISCFEMGSFES